MRLMVAPIIQFLLLRSRTTKVVRAEYDCVQLILRWQWAVTNSHGWVGFLPSGKCGINYCLSKKVKNSGFIERGTKSETDPTQRVIISEFVSERARGHERWNIQNKYHQALCNFLPGELRQHTIARTNYKWVVGCYLFFAYPMAFASLLALTWLTQKAMTLLP
jgi:hypothetical protein